MNAVRDYYRVLNRVVRGGHRNAGLHYRLFKWPCVDVGRFIILSGYDPPK